MKEILPAIDGWLAEGHRVAVARVIGIEGSGPRDPGAAMAVSDDGEWPGRSRVGASRAPWSRSPWRFWPRARRSAARSATPTTRPTRWV